MLLYSASCLTQACGDECGPFRRVGRSDASRRDPNRAAHSNSIITVRLLSRAGMHETHTAALPSRSAFVEGVTEDGVGRGCEPVALRSLRLHPRRLRILLFEHGHDGRVLGRLGLHQRLELGEENVLREEVGAVQVQLRCNPQPA